VTLTALDWTVIAAGAVIARNLEQEWQEAPLVSVQSRNMV